MNITGLQKMTLLDFPGRVACTVFLGGCDFRCPFCHNYEMVDGSLDPLMDDNELIKFLEKRKGLLDGVAVTGGEPCLHKGLPGLLGRFRDLGYAVKLDTNGYHPDVLEEVLKNDLADYVAMDIKNSPEKYAVTCGVPEVDMARIKTSITLLKNGTADYEFRTTAVKELHDARDFEEIGKLIRGAKRYFIQSFTDRDSVPYGGLTAPSKADLEAFAAAAGRFVESVSLRGID